MFLFVSGSSQSQRADLYDIDFLSIRRRLHAGLAQIPGGGGHSQKNLVGVCGPLPKTAIFPTLFMT